MDKLENLKNVKVLVVGDFMLDRYWWGDVTRISPEAPVPVVRLRRSTCSPGGAANVAANIAGLGAEPLLVGCIGTDEDASAFRQALIECNISAEYLVARSDAPTNVKTRVIAHNQQIVRIDHEDTEDITETDEDAMCRAISEALTIADIIVVSDYQKGVLTQKVLRHIFESAGAVSKRVIVDPKGRDFTKYKGATMLTPNKREAADALLLDEGDLNLVMVAGTQLIANLGLEAILITRSEEGMSLFVKGRDEIRLRAAAKEIYDVTGAGDTVIAVIAAALAAGFDYADASTLANIAAGIVVEQVGTSAITLEGLSAVVSYAGLSRPVFNSHS